MKYHYYKDYEDYVNKQTKYNKRKEEWIWVWDETIRLICQDYNDIHGAPAKILCHGTRGGWEQKYFKDNFPDAEILGTEISDTASKYDMTIQHDFSLPLEDWIGQADIVYSNSIDHSINIHKTLQTWRDQLSENGVMYLEVGDQVWFGEPSESDPLSISEEQFNEVLYINRLKIELFWKTEALKHRPTAKNQDRIVTSKVFVLTKY